MGSSDIMDIPEMAGRNEPLPLPPLLAAILQGRVGARRFDLVLEAAIQDGAIQNRVTTKSPSFSKDGMKE